MAVIKPRLKYPRSESGSTFSGGMTPHESMPEAVQYVMLAASNTHFIALAQAVLFRGAGLSVVWPQLLALALIGAVMFAVALRRFRDFLR